MSYNSKARGDPNKNKWEKMMNHHQRPATSFAYINPLKKNSKFLGKIRWELSTQFNYRLIAKYQFVADDLHTARLQISTG